MSWVYFIQHGGTDGAIKIGTTAGSPHARLRALQTGAPEQLHLLAAIPGDARIERELHDLFAEFRVRPDGEWFRADLILRAFIVGTRFATRQPEDDGSDDRAQRDGEQG
jgi:hypothetical protein